MSALELRLDGDRFAPGDVVTGSVHVVEGGRCRSLTVELQFREEAGEYTSVARTADAGTLHTGELAAGMDLPFELVLPLDAPPSFRSAHGRLFWIVDARADERGRDAHAEREIDVQVTRAPA